MTILNSADSTVTSETVTSGTVTSKPETNETETNSSLMRADEALKIIQKIVKGINPLSDEPLDDKHIFLDSDIQRAFETATHALETRIKWEQRQAKLPSNAGKPWTKEEEQALGDDFDSGEDIESLTEKHQRTKGSIISRLEKMGKLTR